MHPNHEFCEAQAREATVKADEAQLENVREQALRAAAAWQAMADKQRSIAEARAARESAAEAAALAAAANV
jgi:hypothetical protein